MQFGVACAMLSQCLLTLLVLVFIQEQKEFRQACVMLLNRMLVSLLLVFLCLIPMRAFVSGEKDPT